MRAVYRRPVVRTLQGWMRRLVLAICRRPDVAMFVAVVIAGVAGLLMLANLTGNLLAEQQELRVEIEEITEDADKRARQNSALTRRAMLCLLAEQADHGANTRTIHDALATVHGIPVPPPFQPPLPYLPPSASACQPFRDGNGLGQ